MEGNSTNGYTNVGEVATTVTIWEVPTSTRTQSGKNRHFIDVRGFRKSSGITIQQVQTSHVLRSLSNALLANDMTRSSMEGVRR